MTALDAVARGAAASAIGAYGKSCVHRSVTIGAYDPATGSATQSLVDTPTRGIADSMSLKTLGFRFGDGLVQGGDIQVTLAASPLSTDPKPGDFITLDSWEWKVVSVRPTWSGDQIAMFDCLVRK